MSNSANETLDKKTSLVVILLIPIYSLVIGIILYHFLKIAVHIYDLLLVTSIIYILTSILFVLLIRHRPNKDYTKKFKSFADLVWNAWSFSAIVVIASSLADESLMEILSRDHAHAYAICAGLVVLSASARMSVSIVECFNLDKSER